MNILKKFFLVSLFCSLFIFSVKASNINEFSTTLVYSQEFENLITEKQNKIDLVKNYINNHNLVYHDSSNTFDIFKDKSVVAIDLNNIDNEQFEVVFLDFSDRYPSPYFEISYETNSNYSKRFFGIFRIFSFNVKIQNGSVSSFTSSSWGSKSFRYNFSEKPNHSSVPLEINDYYFITDFLSQDSKNKTISFNENSSSNVVNVPLYLKSNDTTYTPPTQVRIIDFFDSMYTSNLPVEPSYSYVSNVLDNGNVELTFTFENYNSDSSYGFTIENELSGEEYGVENPFSSIFPKIVPFGNSYSITIPYDTYLYVTLAKYNKVEDSTLYSREEIFTDVIDVNNIVFSNPSNPYFSIDYQSKKFIQGRFNNTKNNDTCFVKFSNNLSSQQVSCSESFTINFDFNGYLSFYVKRKNDIIYNRNINVLGNDSVDYPYIIYNVEKQDFYSIVTFNVINSNYDINMSYRYSLDNGVTWSDYQLIEKEPFSYSINVFSNSNVIFEIANVRSPNNIIVYDSKSVYVVLDISTASGLNSSTDNIIDKFISLISLNDNLINYINLLWNNIKNSKLFLVIMLPFISSIICAIIYLIRRK